MKKYFNRLVFLFIMVAGFSTASQAQIVVKIRPNEPVYTHPVAPSPRHVWVDGEWVNRGGRYVYVNGYWAVPRSGYRWVRGHWADRRGGWYWVPGHWRRR